MELLILPLVVLGGNPNLEDSDRRRKRSSSPFQWLIYGHVELLASVSAPSMLPSGTPRLGSACAAVSARW